MALQKNITLDNGINLPESYIMISSVNYINGYHSTVKVNIYKDRSARLSGKSEVVKFQHLCVDDFPVYFSYSVLDQEGVNIISKGYEYLKTLPFYSDTIDVIDPKE